MSFLSLQPIAFRNLVDGEYDFSGKDIFLIGDNGQGKTNFLEALYCCSYASSFRGVRDSELIRSGKDTSSIHARLSGGIYEKIKVHVEARKKQVFVDGKKVEDRKELLSIVPTVVFCHEDMEFISGTPERRRWFFDQSLSLYDPMYLDDLRRYRRILKTRNLLIKDHKESLLDAVDVQLVQYGLELIHKRREAAEKFTHCFCSIYEAVSDIDAIEVSYMPSWKGEDMDTLIRYLRNRRELDMSFGSSLSGPHRDRYIFARKGLNFALKASTGQRRLLSLLLRVAQALRFSEMTGKAPVLLLDDVLLELDPEKKKRFLRVLPAYEQAFFTFLPEEPYERYRKTDTLVYYIKEGKLSNETGR